ncbi:MAG: zinc-ribbon domain-containing protein [Pseudomonadota bacterium]
MRITCPNCSAQYEIADGMIPAEGRDVQCSNCGTTWHQEARVQDAAASETQAPPPEDVAPSDVPAAAETVPPPAPQPDTPAPTRQTMADERTLDILRQEREHEERLRAEAGQTQQEAAGPPAEPNDAEARETAALEAARMAAAASVARSRGSGDAPSSAPQPPSPPSADHPSASPPKDDVADAIAQALRDGEIDEGDDQASEEDAHAYGADADSAASQAPRRELLPDIEEINSSLRPDDRVAAIQAQAVAEADAAMASDQASSQAEGSGFRIGFLSVVALVLLAVLTYAFADTIVAALPALDNALDTYVNMIDRGRLGVEAGAESLLEMIGPDA